MDTRKLTSRAGYAPHDQALIYDETTSVGVAVTYGDQGGQTAAELVRRWNAYPELVAALDMVQEALAAHRDGSRVIVDHPEHGPITSLEEVKYLTVDPVLNTLTQ